MTSTPTQTRPSPAARPAPSAPSKVGPVPLDPIKLLKKYLWLFVAAAVVGAVLGVGANIVLARTSPSWKSKVVFEVSTPRTNIGNVEGEDRPSEKEMNRFMQTQAAIMTSRVVMENVATDPRLLADAPKWADQFLGDGGNLDVSETQQALSSSVSARVLRGTNLMELSVSAPDPVEATNLVGLVRESYENFLRQQVGRDSGAQRDALQRAIQEQDTSITRLQDRRDRILEEEDVDSLDQRFADSSRQLGALADELIGIRMNLEATQTQLSGLEQELESPTGPTYSDQLRAAARRSPIVVNLRQQITNLENELTSMKLRGIKEQHRTYQYMQSQIEATNITLNTKMEEAMRAEFDTLIDGTRKVIAQLQAQEADLLRQKEDASGRLSELTRIQAEINDLEQEIGRMIDSRNKLRDDLGNIDALQRLADANRVSVLESERIPDARSFPQLKLIGPAGVILVTGLVGGLVVLREILDQRVKGPSDIAVIPRTRVAGTIPYAAEDPSNPKVVETTFRDDPDGVLAESFRQVRGPLLRRMHEAGHKTLLVVSGMPRSGSTSVISNLALASAAADQRVLVVDGNFRRPAQHSAFGLDEAPGLAEVLAGDTSLQDAVRSGGVEGLDVLTVGASENRVIERLGTNSMTDLLNEAKTRYDLVLVDAPPAIVSGDGISLANRCDACLLVVRALGEKRGMVARLKNELSDTNGEFMGVLVNGVRSAVGGYLRRNIRTAHAYRRPKSG